MIKGSKKEDGKVKKITIRLTVDDREELFKKAKMRDMYVSDYVRYLFKKDKPKKTK